uniref:5'-3' exoribonuclease 1 n=1 Tax=Lygus hesperus TaxID=30085 RepID=A0A0A9X165_LYGHE
MKSKSSPLLKYYPEHIEIDREGARAEWEGIVVIPFMNEEELLLAYESVQKDVSVEDARHNVLGPSLWFHYDEKMTPTTLLDDMFGTLRNVLVRREVFDFPPMTTRFVP